MSERRCRVALTTGRFLTASYTVTNHSLEVVVHTYAGAVLTPEEQQEVAEAVWNHHHSGAPDASPWETELLMSKEADQ